MVLDVVFETTQPFDVGFDTSQPFDVGYEVIGGGAIPPNLTSLSITPSESQQTFTPVPPVDGFDDVSVAAIPSDYVGSSITRDPPLGAAGATVTAPAGYYTQAQSKTVQSGSATTPTKTITADPVIQVDSNGLITATELVNAYITPNVVAGWVEQGTQGKITVSGQKTQQLDTVNGQTITPTESVQTAVPAKRFTKGDVKVGAIPSTYVGTGVTRQAGSTVTPTETAQSVVAADTYVTGAIGVDAIPSDYVGSQIERRDSDDLIATGNLVNVPAGYYEENAGKAIAEGSATTPATTITANPSITVGSDGLITAAVSASASVTPTIQTGYVVMGGGTAGTITASGSATEQLTTQAAQTITPTTSDQTIPAETYLTGAQTIKGDPNLTLMNIVGDATIFGVSGYPLNKNTAVPFGQEAGAAAIRNGKKGWVNGNLVTGNMTEKAAATYTPTSADQTIAANQYLAGAQTIEGVVCANLTAGNIKNGVTVKVGTATDDDSVTLVTGTYTGGSPSLQDKSVTPTESVQTVTADAGYDGLDEVTVSAISSTYVGSGITRRSSSSLTASGATVSVPSGYYESNASKAVTSGSATAPATISGTAATVSTGTNTLTLTKTVSVTPSVSAGYVSSGTAGNSSVSLTANVTTQGAQTIHPSASNQTIASGRYLTGTQTINAVTTTNLIAENIKSGVVVQVGDSSDSDCVTSVTGTYSGGGGSSMNTQVAQSTTRTTSTSYTSLVSLTCSTAGTYDVYWSGFRSSTSGTWGMQLYVNGSAYGSVQNTWSNHISNVHLTGVSIGANQTVAVYARSRGSNYYAYIGTLTIVQKS